MLEIKNSDLGAFRTIKLGGRLDGIGAPNLEKELMKKIEDGQRSIIIDLDDVPYMSSAGLRVFLQAQKNLKTIGGELILYKMQKNVHDVFKMSGFVNVYKIVDSEDALKQSVSPVKEEKSIDTKTYKNIHAEFIHKDGAKGKLTPFGNPEKLKTITYTKDDIQSIKPSDIPFGTGLASMCDMDEDYQDLFGEAIIIKNNLFYLPTIKGAKADFMLAGEGNLSLPYQFLYGFSFDGEFSTIMKFDEQDEIPKLLDVCELCNELTESNIYGIVFLAVSGGLYGMNIRKSPFGDDETTIDITNQNTFAEWFDYPIDPYLTGNIIAGVGIVAKDKAKLSDHHNTLFSSDTNIHIHGAIFSKDFLGKNVFEFENEVQRVVNELPVQKVQHILGKTKLRSGIFGLIELEG